ncbi:hypothetical protein ABT336_11610 [Micromonospora sp. NPDC000207]|uniref:hypothetical protein n=1 Tax=Micromonospora sp. NPDC000207 TaxID=3154246 RepID=UPI00332BE04A
MPNPTPAATPQPAQADSVDQKTVSEVAAMRPGQASIDMPENIRRTMIAAEAKAGLLKMSEELGDSREHQNFRLNDYLATSDRAKELVAEYAAHLPSAPLPKAPTPPPVARPTGRGR